jgi:hypothetical protein
MDTIYLLLHWSMQNGMSTADNNAIMKHIHRAWHDSIEDKLGLQ